MNGEVHTTPSIVLIVFVCGIVGLFVLDRDPKARTTMAICVPIIWLMLAGSRPVSQWLVGGGSRSSTVQAYEASAVMVDEGNALERNVFSGLIIIGLIALFRRSRSVSALLRMNAPILMFLFYCALSILWSDYPGVAFKRWVKAIGDVVMISIVLTEPDPVAAIKRLLASVSFIVVPVSFLLIKYYPVLGMKFNPYDGTQTFIGVASDKNMLGMFCLVLGVGAAWRLFLAMSDRHFRPLIAHGVVLLMVAWLFWRANSVTSMACFAMATSLMALSSVPALAKRRSVLHFAVAGCLSVAFAVLFLNIGPGLVESMGRDPSITGRTELWDELRSMNPNVLLGAGFESFWMGPRLAKLWGIFRWRPNEAHNGYFEVFLNLGLVGLILLAVVICTGYRNAFRMLTRDPRVGALRLAYFLIGTAYSFTEAGFRLMSPVWICFILAALAVPENPVPTTADVVQPLANSVARRFRRTGGQRLPNWQDGAVSTRFSPRVAGRKSASVR